MKLKSLLGKLVLKSHVENYVCLRYILRSWFRVTHAGSVHIGMERGASVRPFHKDLAGV